MEDKYRYRQPYTLAQRLYLTAVQWWAQNVEKFVKVKTIKKKKDGTYTAQLKSVHEVKLESDATPFKGVKLPWHLNLFAVLFAIALALLFTGCKDNPVTNGNNNPPVVTDSLYFSFDSLVARGTGNQVADTSFLDGRNVNHIKIQFTLETNCIASDNAFVTLRYLNHTDHTIMDLDSLNHTFTIEETASGTNFANFEATLFKSSSGERYLRMKNLKYYKVN